MNDPIDRFFVGNMKVFLNKPFDELVADATNEKLIDNHLPMLACETDGELQPSDEAILGRAFYDAARKDGGKPPRGYRPHRQLNMRGGMGESFELKIQEEGVGQISAMRKFREAYIGAIFTFFGQRYVVRSHEKDAVILEEASQHQRTEAGFFTVVSTNDVFDGFAYGGLEVYYGSLNVVTNFSGYKVVDDRTDEVVGTGGSSAAHYQNNLHAFWIDVPESTEANEGIGALEHLIRVGAMFVIPADRFDTSTYSKTGDQAAAFYYENYTGSIGVAKKLFSVWEQAVSKGIEVAERCGCRSGCQICIEPAKSYNVSNAFIDKVRGVELARRLLRDARGGPDRRFRNGRMIVA